MINVDEYISSLIGLLKSIYHERLLYVGLQGSIVRKIGVMGYLPETDKSMNKFIFVSRDEYAEFVEETIQLVAKQFTEMSLI